MDIYALTFVVDREQWRFIAFVYLPQRRSLFRLLNSTEQLISFNYLNGAAYFVYLPQRSSLFRLLTSSE